MIDLMSLCAFNARYAQAIDSGALELWPGFFCEQCKYRITNVENERDGLPAGIVYADSRAMLEDRIAALREANIYEAHRYRHLLGIPLIETADDKAATARTPFMVARIMHTGETSLFVTGEYLDRFVFTNGQLLLAERVAVCDSTVTDTLLALPL
ncbi:nuclear transport factor 2 family protein [Caenimonas sp. SL110]|uniref:aromatic-ring-hydroxylating dioxygenase subunit beta n=1 Tax=Caenimonas sp. SL110 TaxID=1450524 RepID=UPI0009E419F2|nr:nuclear transport factor 2 family protein [Caenimonas sp. SL110]